MKVIRALQETDYPNKWYCVLRCEHTVIHYGADKPKKLFCRKCGA